MKKSIVVLTSIILGMMFFVFIFAFISRSFSTMSMKISDTDSKLMETVSDSVSQRAPQTETTQKVIRDMNFVDYGTHIFVSPDISPYSTFALDVDAASYTIAKNYVMNGKLPPKDAIRPEEFVNYFDYDYPDPEKNIDIYSGLSMSPFDEDVTYLRLGVKAQEPEIIKPKKITLVIDTSGSMSTNNRLGLLKKGLSYLINNLNENDYVSIITYNSKANLYMETQKGDKKDYILSQINALSPGGSTNAEAGLNLGYSKADDVFDSDYVNRVILLSDGVANVGNTDSDSILGQLKSYKEKGITLTSIGVGLGNYNDVLLEQIADNANGNYFYINELDEAIRVFDKQIDATMQVAATDTKLQVHFYDNVVNSYRLVGYENRALSRSDFENESVDAGEIGAGHEATAIYELKLKNNPGKICDVTLRYKYEGESYEEQKSIQKEIIGFDSVSNDFKLSVIAARYAQILKLTAPPTQIDIVKEILDSIDSDDKTISDFKDVVTNAKSLINQKR